MKKIGKIQSLILIFISLMITAYGQTDEKIKLTKVSKQIGEINIEINQYKSLIESPNIPYCRAQILIFKNNLKIDSIDYPDMDGVGGSYGLLVYPDLINNHVIISKYGDYDGQTVIINKNGDKFITIGGNSYIDKSSGLLFSIYDSDLSGFNVFDLRNDKEIVKFMDMEDRPQLFYKYDDKYFVETINDETGKKLVWIIMLKTKIINKIETDQSDIKKEQLQGLADYSKIYIKCE